MQEIDAPATIISSMDGMYETNEEWRVLQPMDKEQEGTNVYDHLHLDPRFFFLGDPSSYRKEHCAEELIKVRERSIRTGTRAVSFFPQPWITSGRRKQPSYLMGPPTNCVPSGIVHRRQLNVQQPRRRKPSTHLHL
uniref:Uncharacterized protein n=1 Tax=Magallana gigas TaxID=29159 RepID=K1Q1X6_MAGGI